MARVVVTNRNEEPFSGSFDGKLYAFEPGAPVPVDVTVAAFFFGFGLAPVHHERILVRNGWLKTSNDADPFGPKAARARLLGFSFNKAEEPARKIPKAIDLPAKPQTPPEAAAGAQGAPVKPQAPSGGAQESETDEKATAGATAAHPDADSPALPLPGLKPGEGDQGFVKRTAGIIRGAIGMPKGSAPRAAIGPAPR